jgi:hypothetical protein
LNRQREKLLNALVDIAYRALVGPPGMTYAIPVLIWWALLWRTRPTPVRG